MNSRNQLQPELSSVFVSTVYDRVFVQAVVHAPVITSIEASLKCTFDSDAAS